jgi:periplasmic protein CpxP/Spy
MKLILKLKQVAIATGILLSLMTLNPGEVQAQTNGLLPIMDGIELTQSQQVQFDTLRQQTRSQITSILTSEQREQLRDAWTEDESLRETIANLNLTSSQREQLRQVFQSARTDFRNILTSEQQQQLRRNIQELVLQR